MAKLVFPPTPIQGQVYTATNKITYQWDGSKWNTRLVESYATFGANPGVNPPANPANGTFWWDSESGQLYVYYIEDSGSASQSAQWMQASLLGQVVDSDGNAVNNETLSSAGTQTGVLPLSLELEGSMMYDGVPYDKPVLLEHEQDVTITDSGNVSQT